ncbi:cytochrome P450 monooxygenase-like protein [Leptodontidium sp. 2 PMI_412]|nr:cytochrome P450 monooxygenase-like protein [Leptodontidium sp. 2 PMI_412]
MTGIYNLFFHPFARYPGPKLAAVSHLWYGKHWIGGRFAFDLYNVHQKYGNIVRIAPNELSFSSLQAFNDLYGHVTKNKKPFLKSAWYDMPDEMSPLGAERDPVRHSTTRRQLAHAFSVTALSQQSPIIHHYVDLFMRQLAKYGGGEGGVDVDEWFNWLTFDIVGDLGFGQSFGAVEQAKTNPQITILVNILYAGSIFDIFRRMPYLKPLAPLFVPISKLKKERAIHQEFSLNRIQERIAKGNDRPDFFGHLLANKETAPSEEFLRTNASSLLIAGSETTATALAGITYYLLSDPKTFSILKEEVRNAFNDHTDITDTSTKSLPYLFGVIEESLRIFPPLPINLPRVSPGAPIDGHFVPKGMIASSHQYTLSHSPAYFTDPFGFRPERWLPSTHSLYNHKFANDILEASKPFLLGPRTCLGKNMAYMELRIILTKLVFLFDWEAVQTLGEGQEVHWERDTRVQFLWAKPQFRVRYRPRVEF